LKNKTGDIQQNQNIADKTEKAVQVKGEKPFP
jgi:hypothetical protein